MCHWNVHLRNCIHTVLEGSGYWGQGPRRPRHWYSGSLKMIGKPSSGLQSHWKFLGMNRYQVLLALYVLFIHVCTYLCANISPLNCLSISIFEMSIHVYRLISWLYPISCWLMLVDFWFVVSKLPTHGLKSLNPNSCRMKSPHFISWISDGISHVYPPWWSWPWSSSSFVALIFCTHVTADSSPAANLESRGPNFWMLRLQNRRKTIGKSHGTSSFLEEFKGHPMEYPHF